jgi:hypothetical protein
VLTRLSRRCDHGAGTWDGTLGGSALESAALIMQTVVGRGRFDLGRAAKKMPAVWWSMNETADVVARKYDFTRDARNACGRKPGANGSRALGGEGTRRGSFPSSAGLTSQTRRVGRPIRSTSCSNMKRVRAPARRSRRRRGRPPMSTAGHRPWANPMPCREAESRPAPDGTRPARREDGHRRGLHRGRHGDRGLSGALSFSVGGRRASDGRAAAATTG